MMINVVGVEKIIARFEEHTTTYQSRRFVHNSMIRGPDFTGAQLSPIGITAGKKALFLLLYTTCHFLLIILFQYKVGLLK